MDTHEEVTADKESSSRHETQTEHTTSSTTPTGKSAASGNAKTQIDGMSREDLIKHIKKQTLFLQKMKSRVDELNGECTRLKGEASIKTENHLIQEVQILKSERDQLQSELKQTKQIVLSQEQKYEEQIASLLSEKSTLEKELSESRDSQVSEINDARRNNDLLSQKVNDLESVVCDITGARDTLSADIKALNNSYETLKEDKQQVQNQLAALQEKFDVQIDEWTKEKEKLHIEISKLVADAKQLRIESDDNQERAQRDMEKLSVAKEQEIQSFKVEIESLQTKLTIFERESCQKDEEIASLKLLMNSLQEKDKSVTVTQQSHKETSTCDLHQPAELTSSSDRLLQESASKQTEEKTKLLDDKHKDEVKKLKAYAVKLKKELAEVQEREKAFKQELIDVKCSLGEEQKLSKEVKSSLDQTNEKYNNVCQELKREQQDRQNLTSSTNKLMKEKHAVETSLQSLEETHSSLRSELELIKTTLLSTQSELASVKRSYTNSVTEVQSLRETIANEREKFDELKQKLATVEKESKSASLMNLELADYQRSLETLRGQLKDKESLCLELEQKLSSSESKNQQLVNEIASCKDDIVQKEDVTAKVKAILHKSTKELTDTKAQLVEESQKSEEIKATLETTRQNLEASKMEIASITSSFHSDLEQAKASQTHYQQLVHSLESKIFSLQSELDSAKKTNQIQQNEFDSYKVRVHSVLKQKESKLPSTSDIEASLKQQQEVEFVKMKAELNEARERLGNLLTEHEEVQNEHKELLNEHERYVSESKQELLQLQNKVLETEENCFTKTQKSDSVVAQLRLEIAENTAAFKSQIYTTQKNYQSQLDLLQKQLRQAKDELGQQKRELEANNAAVNLKDTSHLTIKDSSKYLTDTKVLPTPIEERSSGEGMDCMELEVSKLASRTSTPSSLVQNNNDQFVSFEHLLNTTVTSSVSTPSEQTFPTLESQDIHHQNSVLLKKVKHLTELLHESEANCMRFTDQTKLLKEEIRRLERNQERQKEASSNMEYLKNVVLKFLNSPNDERLKLVHIITQLLHLSQQEKHFLNETLKGKNVDLPDPTGESPTTTAAGGKSLVNYLHRWTGYQ